MDDNSICVGGDGGPLVILQASAVLEWQGANNWDNSVMNGGIVETDYDVVCNDELLHGGCVLNYRGRDMLVLWQCEFGGRLLEPSLLMLSSDSILITNCMVDENGVPFISEFKKLLDDKPYSSQRLLIQDNMLRLQVGADGSVPSQEYGYIDVPIMPGAKQVDYYMGQHGNYGEFIVIANLSQNT